jgi:glycerol-3-phosphate dehydrogenase (NAD(P)+)
MGNLACENGHEVLGWAYEKSVIEEINIHHTNQRYLKDIPLYSDLSATNNLEEVFQECQMVFVALPSVFITGTLEPIRKKISSKVLLVNLTKGIDSKTGLTAFQTLHRLLPGNRAVVLSGPSVANEFAHHMPTSVVIAGPFMDDLLAIANVLDNEYFRTRFSDDAMGVELGGILKNIYAIGLGMFDGKNITSVNVRSVYLTIAVEEMSKFGVGMGAKVETFLYLSGMGDLLATALSEHSHNRYMGILLAQGYSQNEIREKMGVLPEGYNTLITTLYIAEKMHIAMPLAKGLMDVIQGRYTPDSFISYFIKGFVE